MHDETQDARWLLAAIVDSSDDAIISKNLDGVISSWNVAAERLFGYSAAEAIGQPITFLIPAQLHAEERELLRRVRAGERIEHLETRRVTRDGRLLDVSLTISPVRDASGTIVGASKILRDTTESKRAHEAVRQNEQRLAHEVAGARTLQSISTRLIAESTTESLFEQILDAAIELMDAQAASVQMLEADGSLTLLGSRSFHPESAAFWRQVSADAASTCAVALRGQTRVLVTDVEACEFMAGTQDLLELRRSGIRAVQSTPLRSRAGRPLGMLSTHWRTPHTPSEDDFRLFDILARQTADLIERTRAEDAVRESEERFRLIANTAPVIIWMSDLSKGNSYVNQTWLDLTGQQLDEVLGNGWTDRVHPDDIAQAWDIYSRAFDRREMFQIDFRLRRHDDDYRWIVSVGAPRYSVNGSFAGYIGSAIDVTERRLAEDALATINQRVIDAQEEERAHIARELHDDVVQRLSVLSVRLHSCLHPHGSEAATRREIEEATIEVTQLSKDVQALSHRLHPAVLEYLGLDGATKALCRELANQHGLAIDCHIEPVPKGLSRRVSACLYRVLQEALQNAIKHGGARRVDVALCVGVEEIELTIRDTGSGFDVGIAHQQGLGLTTMKERLKAVRGRLAIQSQPQHGTTIHACVPVAEAISAP